MASLSETAPERRPLRPALRPMRFDGERRWALGLEMGDGDPDVFVASTTEAMLRAEADGAVLAYGFVDGAHAAAVFHRLGWTTLGPAPALVRPLRLSAASKLPGFARAVVPNVPLVLPFGGARRAGVREITTRDPRVTRLWDRFSIDVPVAIERNASYLDERVWGTDEHRVFIFEDGDRYVIRALCIFNVKRAAGAVRGDVIELLHDRSVAGMRAASHLLGLALREMSDAGAEAARAWSLLHSGSFPILARHAFLPVPRSRSKSGLHFGVRALAPAVAPLVTERRSWYLSGLDFANT